MTAAQAATYSAPALEKGLDVLELLCDAPGGLTQQQIAAGLGRSASELFRMIEVLVRRGYLSRDVANGTYLPTLKLFELAHRQAPVRRLVGAALPHMHELARATRQSNHLVVHYDSRILVVAQVDSPAAMGFSVRLGAHFPFCADRVSPRVLAAFQGADKRADLIAEMRRNDPKPPSATLLARWIEAIAARGFEERVSDTTPGIIDLCFPVVDHAGCAIATLTQPFLKQRDVSTSLAVARAAHAQAVAAISRDLGAPIRPVALESQPAKRRSSRVPART